MKNIPFAIVFVAFLFSHQLFSETVIPAGEVSGTWTKAVSPYHIIGNITIPDSATLEIEPEIQVIFDGHYKIDVQGRLIAVGEVDKMITFTMSDTTLFSDTSTTDGGWNGIRFLNTPNNNDTSKIIYCRLEFSKKLNRAMNDANGGAIHVKNFSKLIFENNIVSNNLALGNGGGIYCESASFTINNNVISNNIAYESGGGSFFKNCSVIISENDFIENDCNESGGGVSCEKSYLFILSNLFTYNSARDLIGFRNGGGGGIHSEKGTIIAINNELYNNKSERYGGGIQCDSGIIINNYIQFNYCRNAGSGLFTEQSYILNNIISNNTGYGGLYTNESSYNGNWYGKIVNNTICNNYGDGLRLSYSSPIIYNTIIYNNDGHQIGFFGDEDHTNDTHPDIFNCNIEGGKDAIETIPTWGYTGKYENNIDKYPLFTNDPDNPYSLSEDSPCINAGAPDTTGLNIPLYDIIGMPRIHAGRIDMGAYEFQGEVSVKELRNNNFILLYPNPTDGLLIIDIHKPGLLPLTIEIIDIFGRTLREEIIGEIHNRIDLSNFSNGNYFLTIRNHKIIASKKFVIYK